MRLPDNIYNAAKPVFAHHAPWHFARLPENARLRGPGTAFPDLKGIDQPGSGEQFLRFFAPKSVANNGGPVFGTSPWSPFSGGTRISTGLAAGEDALRRAGVTHGTLVLMSDLNDSQNDRDPLVAEAAAIRKAHVPIRILPLNATPQDLDVFANLFGPNVFVSPRAFTQTPKQRVEPTGDGYGFDRHAWDTDLHACLPPVGVGRPGACAGRSTRSAWRSHTSS